MKDILPGEMEIRDYVLNIIKDTYRGYGFSAIETPCVEHIENLTSKQGGDNEKLIFKILKRGEKLNVEAAQTEADVVDGGLRYDLTLPLSRYYANNSANLSAPFKALQVGSVWRADRPQKGRYREFYQCDADVVGSDSLLNEVELLMLTDKNFRDLGINVCIKINNRKILSGIAETIGEADKIIDITVAIDKIDKIGLDNVNAELREKGLSESAISALRPILELTGTNDEKLQIMSDLLKDSETGMKGIAEMKEIVDAVSSLGLRSKVEIDVSLARGLNYYTGTILEVKALDVEIGSISGGGRYDNLTGVFGMPGLSGVGISYGADRIYDVMVQLDLFPDDLGQTVKVMFVNFGEKEALQSLKYVKALRENGIPAQLYPDNAKMKKQMSAADSDYVPYVAFVGESELGRDAIVLKDMNTGEQSTFTLAEVIERLS